MDEKMVEKFVKICFSPNIKVQTFLAKNVVGFPML